VVHSKMYHFAYNGHEIWFDAKDDKSASDYIRTLCAARGWDVGEVKESNGALTVVGGCS